MTPLQIAVALGNKPILAALTSHIHWMTLRRAYSQTSQQSQHDQQLIVRRLMR